MENASHVSRLSSWLTGLGRSESSTPRQCLAGQEPRRLQCATDIARRKLGPRRPPTAPPCFANMAAALIEHEQIVTTLPKAKELRPVVEKLVTLAQARQPACAPPCAWRAIRDDGHAVKKLFEVIGSALRKRPGRLYPRAVGRASARGDNAAMAVIEFIVDRATRTPRPGSWSGDWCGRRGRGVSFTLPRR